jgi:hypothetical protein
MSARVDVDVGGPDCAVFSVDVVRIVYGHRTLTVRAPTREDAEEAALDAAGDFDYSVRHAEYEVG